MLTHMLLVYYMIYDMCCMLCATYSNVRRYCDYCYNLQLRLRMLLLLLLPPPLLLLLCTTTCYCFLLTITYYRIRMIAVALSEPGPQSEDVCAPDGRECSAKAPAVSCAPGRCPGNPGSQKPLPPL